MTKLEEVLQSLITLLIRYHDSQPKVKKKLIIESDTQLLRKKSRSLALKIVQDQHIDHKTYLTTLIETATKGYPDRKPFLLFILHEILFLTALKNLGKPLTPHKLTECNQLIVQLFIDFKKLLVTTKTKTYKVQYSLFSDEKITEENTKSISLSGLANGSYLQNSLCNSGSLLNEEVLVALNILISSTDNEIRIYAESLCMEHQNTLLISQLQSSCLFLTQKNLEQQGQINSLMEQLQQSQTETIEQAIQINKLNQKNIEQSKNYTDLLSNLNQLEQNFALHAESSSQKVTELENIITHHNLPSADNLSTDTISAHTIDFVSGLTYYPSFFTNNINNKQLQALIPDFRTFETMDKEKEKKMIGRE